MPGDNWKEFIYRQCVNCRHCQYEGNAMFRTICELSNKAVQTNEHIGCGGFSDKRKRGD